MTSAWRQLDFAHQWSLYFIALISFFNVALSGGVGIVVSTLFLVAVTASWFYYRKHAGTQKEASQWWNVAIIVFLFLTIGDILFGPTILVVAGIRFLLVLLVIKLYGRFRDRDDLQVYALTLMLFAAGTIVNDGLSYGIFFAIYVLSGTISLALFHLRSELRTRKIVATTGGPLFSRHYLFILIAISAGIFATSVIIFFMFPRVGLGFFATQTRDPVTVTGFNEDVDLGNHGVVRDNPEVVMRVEFPEGRPESFGQFYWRTLTFDHYDGRRWRRTLSDETRFVRAHARGEYELSFMFSDAFNHFLEQHHQTLMHVYLEPIGTNLLPVLWPSKHVQIGGSELPLPRTPRSGSLLYDSYGDLRHTIENQIGVPYSLSGYTSIPSHFQNQTVGSALRYDLEEAFLQLPELPERVHTLAQQITAQATSNYAKALAIQEHFAQNFAYTTVLPQVDETQPIVSFLFDAQRGHCEYFATAAVILARSAGVPARLVNGFLGGTWNDVGDFLSVRQGNAHSWVEIYVPDYGWMLLDPTPSSTSPLDNQNPTMRWARDSYDAMKMAWFKWVIEYDLETQAKVLRELGRSLRRADNSFRPVREKRDQANAEVTSRNTGVFVLFLVIALVALLAYFHGRRVKHKTSHVLLSLVFWITMPLFAKHLIADVDENFISLLAIAALIAFGSGLLSGRLTHNRMSIHRVARYFHQLETLGAKVGVNRGADEGPAHYLYRLRTTLPHLELELQEFERIYLRIRFGALQPSPQQLLRLRTSLRKIARGIQRRARKT